MPPDDPEGKELIAVVTSSAVKVKLLFTFNEWKAASNVDLGCFSLSLSNVSSVSGANP